MNMWESDHPDKHKDLNLILCPFCGEKADFKQTNNFSSTTGRIMWVVTCNYCHACSGESNSCKEVARKWNKRSLSIR